jgi:hypothetical protein
MLSFPRKRCKFNFASVLSFGINGGIITARGITYKRMFVSYSPSA